MRTVSFRLAVVVAALFAVLTGVGTDRAADGTRPLDAAFERDVKPFLARYCVRCHTADKQTSGVRVDQLGAAVEDRHLRLWEDVRRQVGEKAMPPEGAARPTDEERKRVVEWAGGALAAARSRPVPKNGQTRRLTVAQYRDTLRELLRLDDDFTDLLLPDAVSRDGFLNNAETQQLSPLLLEAYFEIAERALDRAVVDPSARPTVQSFRVDLGAGINRDPSPDKLVLGANSHLLNNADVVVTQPRPAKPFAFDPFAMTTRFRFIEGYEGNATVRGWRDFAGVHHAVFACVRGADGYPKGRAFGTVPQGLLLRPAVPSAELFGVDSTYGPKANFKIAVRELPDHGRFRVTVTGARYDDGLLLDPGAAPQPGDGPGAIVFRDTKEQGAVTIPKAGVYQVDVHTARREPSNELTLSLGERRFAGALKQPAFLVARLAAGELAVRTHLTGAAKLDRIAFTPLAADHEAARRFAAFEKRAPRLGVYLGFRRDCGSTLAPVGPPRTVADGAPTRFVFEGAIRNFPSPDVEKDNVNYLAGIREIGVRSEYTDGRDVPRLLVRSVEFEGPFFEAWPPPSHRAVFGEGDDTDAHGRKAVREFAARAYRRPVTAREEATLIAVFDQSRSAGRNVRDSVKDVLQVVLTSPQFLFLTETSRTPDAEPLDDHELASKLSYFLWNGPPDAATRKLAASGELRTRLDAEVDRMVADPRFDRFVGEFAAQWLALDKFQVLEPDRKLFPNLTRDTRAQLRREPVEFVKHLMRNNLPVRHLIASDFLVANEVVAGYYGLGDRTESGFDFVPLKHGRSELGGVLTQAAVLAGLSDGRESNPVKRGAWVARRIVAEPPDDPPPNVPALTEDTGRLPLRERLERHRNQPGCANCHARIDPWGVPFEEFDAGGRLKAKLPDARSTLPDATAVSGVADLKRHLAGDRLDQVAFSVLKHLATYATGRTLAHRELEDLKRDGLALKADGYRMRDMVRFVVRSRMFLEK